jgi:hypothetical protein
VTTMAEDYGYKTDAVKATSVASEEIDQTFRSSCIGPLGANRIRSYMC